MPHRIALVSRDPAARLALAAAFDHAPRDWSVELNEHASAADVVVFGPDIDEGDMPSGALRFDPSRPDDMIEAVTERLGGGLIVVVTSPIGGAGATSVALHLALVLEGSASTCYLELDPGGGAACRLGFAPASVRTFGNDHDVTQVDTGAALPIPGGCKVLLAPSEVSDEVAESALDLAAAAFAQVVVDVPVGPLLGPALARCRSAVLVIPPTVPAASRARIVLEAWPGVAWAVVTNRVGPGGEATRASLGRLTGRRISLELPCCPALRDAEDEGRLLLDGWTRWRRAVARLARASLER